MRTTTSSSTPPAGRSLVRRSPFLLRVLAAPLLAAGVFACAAPSSGPSEEESQRDLSPADPSQMGTWCENVSCPDGATCGYAAAASECPLGACVADGRIDVVRGGNVRKDQYCSVECEHHTCPAGWACVENRVPGIAKVCAKIPAKCGDGEVQVDEACDDGNEEDGDGCSKDCRATMPASFRLTLKWEWSAQSSLTVEGKTMVPHPYVAAKDEGKIAIWADFVSTSDTEVRVAFQGSTVYRPRSDEPPRWAYIKGELPVPRQVGTTEIPESAFMEASPPNLYVHMPPEKGGKLEVTRVTSDGRTIDFRVQGWFAEGQRDPIWAEGSGRIVLP